MITNLFKMSKIYLVDLANHDIPTILDFLVAADELVLDDLIEHLQTYLIEQHSNDLKEHDYFKKLHNFCAPLNIQVESFSYPQQIFFTFNFKTRRLVYERGGNIRTCDGVSHKQPFQKSW